MLCRACQDLESRNGVVELRLENGRKAANTPLKRRAKGGKREHRANSRVTDELCSRCGHLVGTEDTIRRVRAKQSQLARFGLAGSRGALLKRKPRDER